MREAPTCRLAAMSRSVLNSYSFVTSYVGMQVLLRRHIRKSTPKSWHMMSGTRPSPCVFTMAARDGKDWERSS